MLSSMIANFHFYALQLNFVLHIGSSTTYWGARGHLYASPPPDYATVLFLHCIGNKLKMSELFF